MRKEPPAPPLESSLPQKKKAAAQADFVPALDIPEDPEEAGGVVRRSAASPAVRSPGYQMDYLNGFSLTDFSSIKCFLEIFYYM